MLPFDIPTDQPVLIAGPTASGKSALALEIARTGGGVIVNADALQVFANWRIVTARPSKEEEAQAPHALYGHIPGDQSYSVGHWLRDVTPYLNGDLRPIIVGGTGLNLSALTEGLADIPLTPPAVRADCEAILQTQGAQALLNDLDAETLARIDTLNPARISRAWEVQRTTGRGLAQWQDDTPAPLLSLSDACAIVLNADRDWLRARIEARFDLMIENGAIEEAQDNLASWDPKAPSSKAIGAPELMDYLNGNCTLEEAKDRAIVASQQYAKRQRTWFRKRMSDWKAIPLPA